LTVPLRIAVKKLRYANGFFHGTMKLGDRKIVGALKELQDALGKLNDFAIHEKLSNQIIKPDRAISDKSDKAFGLGVLGGKEDEKGRRCLAAAREAVDTLGRAKI
jgi:CHAD domain-containing protein